MRTGMPGAEIFVNPIAEIGDRLKRARCLVRNSERGEMSDRQQRIVAVRSSL
jgi:hypothetical protein